MLVFYGFYNSVGSFVGQVAVYNEDGMDGSRNPKEQCQNDIEQELNGLATEQDGNGR